MSFKKEVNKNIPEKYIPIVLCAGFGTRLKPITNYIPKVVCPIIDTPLAFFSIEKFFDAGFDHVYCNTHYLPHLVESELRACAKKRGYDPSRIIFFHESQILGSGGGILNIFNQLGQKDSKNQKKDVIAVSGDIVADIPLDLMLSEWENRNLSDVALMLSLPLDQEREDLMCVSNDGKQVIGFGKKFLNENQTINPISRLFSNHQIIGYENFKRCNNTTGSSVELFYNKILEHDKTIRHCNFPESSFWFNVGDIQEYKKCLNFFIKEKKFPLDTKNYMHFDYSKFGEDIKTLLNLK